MSKEVKPLMEQLAEDQSKKLDQANKALHRILSLCKGQHTPMERYAYLEARDTLMTTEEPFKYVTQDSVKADND
jgi:ATP-dependent protease ClpP protease subunit